MKRVFAALMPVIAILLSCAGSRNYSPVKKFPARELQQDYSLLREILEKKHPSLYWYTSRDSMNMYFTRYYNAIKDSMTEQQFTWHVLAPLVDKIHCGHTTVRSSKGFAKWANNRRFPSFPLFMKVWNDTMAVTANLNRKDSILKRGTIITSINGVNSARLIDKIFDHLPEDGYANNVNYVRMSANFPHYHRNIFGLTKNYRVNYLDSAGKARSILIPLYNPLDSAGKAGMKVKDSSVKVKRPKVPHVKKVLQYRTFTIDSTGTYATMTVNTFSKGRLRAFFRRSFRTLEQKKIRHLIVDIRSNGGGDVVTSTLFTRYLSRKPFRIADSLYAVSKSLKPYTGHIRGKFLNNLEMVLISKRMKDGYYHIRHLENKVYKPKRKFHYNGQAYVLTNGPTFSASTLFCNTVKGQQGITLLGEETGGGWHGNNGIMIPDIKLPNSKVRVRLPLFRLVQYNHQPKTGTGVIPDIYIGTSYDALLKGTDKKMEVVKEIIFSSNKEEEAKADLNY